MLGRWPADQVDHINLIRSDNRWCNLREATQSENARNTRARHNNTSGVKGVNKYRDKWHAKISFNGRRIHLGYFDTPEEAHAVYCRAAAKYHGVYARAS